MKLATTRSVPHCHVRLFWVHYTQLDGTVDSRWPGEVSLQFVYDIFFKFVCFRVLTSMLFSVFLLQTCHEDAPCVYFLMWCSRWKQAITPTFFIWTNILLRTCGCHDKLPSDTRASNVWLHWRMYVTVLVVYCRKDNVTMLVTILTQMLEQWSDTLKDWSMKGMIACIHEKQRNNICVVHWGSVFVRRFQVPITWSLAGL